MLLRLERQLQPAQSRVGSVVSLAGFPLQVRRWHGDLPLRLRNGRAGTESAARLHVHELRQELVDVRPEEIGNGNLGADHVPPLEVLEDVLPVRRVEEVPRGAALLGEADVLDGRLDQRQEDELAEVADLAVVVGGDLLFEELPRLLHGLRLAQVVHDDELVLATGLDVLVVQLEHRPLLQPSE